jgi:hypothetical protein
MTNIQTKLDYLYQEMQKEEFLKQRGLGNEVPYFIFDYDPKDELIIRSSVDRFLKKLPIKVLHIDLFRLMLEQFEEIGLDNLFALEAEEGTEELFDAMKPSLHPRDITQQIADRIEDHQVIFLTRIGSVYPLIRSHEILNNLAERKIKIPVVVFYPGSFSGLDLKLFNKFSSQGYYRAFAIDERV